MPVTKDLKDSEFELTVLCPVGPCRVQHTYAYDRELIKHPALLKDAKRQIIELTEKAHKDGKHRLESYNG